MQLKLRYIFKGHVTITTSAEGGPGDEAYTVPIYVFASKRGKPLYNGQNDSFQLYVYVLVHNPMASLLRYGKTLYLPMQLVRSWSRVYPSRQEHLNPPSVLTQS